MTLNLDITEARRGDVVRFKSYALRVEAEPIRSNGKISLTGRISIDGCPIVTKKFTAGRLVTIDRP